MISPPLLPLLLFLGAANAFIPQQPHSRHVLFNFKHVNVVARRAALSEAEKLEQQLRKVREELAALEGKTVDAVEEEAQRAADAKEARRTALAAEKEAAAAARASGAAVGAADGRHLSVPETGEAMVDMAARAVERALRDGITRQTVRFQLVPLEGPTADIDAFAGWPGGPQQMFSVAGKPLTMALLSRVRTKNVNSTSFVGSAGAPKVTVQDMLAFDGSGLVTAEASEQEGGAAADAQAVFGANTDAKYIDDIEEIDAAMGPDRLFLLVSPFWRGIESWGINLLQPNAKRRAQEVIFDRCGFGDQRSSTFALLRFSVRGERCAALRAYPYPWQIYAYLEDDFGNERPVRLGSIRDEEPSSEKVAALINAEPEFQLSKNMRRMNRR